MAVEKLLTATPDELGWSMLYIGVVITPKSFSAQKNSYLPCAQATISDVRKKWSSEEGSLRWIFSIQILLHISSRPLISPLLVALFYPLALCPFRLTSPTPEHLAFLHSPHFSPLKSASQLTCVLCLFLDHSLPFLVLSQQIL